MRGFINVNKPEGMSSNKAVVIARGILKAATGDKKIKVGHLGTLDPMACGVLPISVGTATRLFDFLSQKTKTYEAVFTFGETTDSLDRETEICQSNGIVPTADAIDEALKAFRGKISQVPPNYSAISLNGVKAYKLARKGRDIVIAPRQIEIFRFERTSECTNAKSYAFTIECSSGTYIRALARDLAQATGTIGFMSYLKRTKNGFFDINSSVTLEQLNEKPLSNILSVEEVLQTFETFDLPEQDAFHALNGLNKQFDNLPIAEMFPVKYRGQIVGIGKNEGKTLKFAVRL